MDMNTGGYAAYPGYYPSAYNQVMPGPYMAYGGDGASVPAVGVSAAGVPATIPGYGQNPIHYSLGSFPVAQQGQPGGYIVPPAPVYNTFVHPSTRNGNQPLNVNPNLVPMLSSAPPQNHMAMPENLAVEAGAPVQQQHVLPATVPGNS
jgi:hypothetical protein